VADRSHLYERVPQAYRDDPSRFALNPLDRTCLDRWLAGETQASIAEALGVSAGRISQRIFRAERHIQRQITREVRRQREGIPMVLTAAEEERWWEAWLLRTTFAGKVAVPLRRTKRGALVYNWRSRSGNLSKSILSYDIAAFAREVQAWEEIVRDID